MHPKTMCITGDRKSVLLFLNRKQIASATKMAHSSTNTKTHQFFSNSSNNFQNCSRFSDFVKPRPTLIWILTALLHSVIKPWSRALILVPRYFHQITTTIVLYFWLCHWESHACNDSLKRRNRGKINGVGPFNKRVQGAWRSCYNRSG